jgi:Glycosyl transferase family 11
MFVFQFMGGLGNQLFQYAAARALSVKRDIPFRIDFDDPYKFVKRELCLSAFNLEVQQATWWDLQRCKPKRRIEKRLWMLVGKDPSCRLYREQGDYSFDPGFFSCRDGAYLSGFWQTEKYFLDIEDIIRSDFEFIIPASEQNDEWLKKINFCTSVSVHVRRGDVISVAKTNKIYGTITPEFYEKAMNDMAASFKDCVFFFFSDDIEWVKQHIKTTYPSYYVDANDDAHNYEDLRLMSSCRHHIIANSSFSWWGAWLNPDKQKKVIGPAKWMSTRNISDTDHIPESWILL